MGWMTRVQFPAGALMFSLPLSPEQFWCPPSLLSNGTGDSCPGVKQPRHEVNHSPLCSVKVKNVWNYVSISYYGLMAWCLVKHRDNFILLI